MSDALRVQRPCGKKWADLAGDDARRFCSDCNKLVYNLDALSRQEIDGLRAGGGFCGTYIAAGDGWFVLPPPAASPSMLPRTALAAVALVSVLSGCSNEIPAPPARTEKPAVSAQAAPKCEQRAAAAEEKYAQMSPDERKELEEKLRALGYVTDP